MNVGFIGLGNMGAPMAMNILKNGHRLIVYNRASNKAPPYKSYGNLIEQNSFTPANFAVPLGLKDIKLALDAAERVNLAMPVAAVARDHLVQAIAQGYRDEDMAVIARVIANNLTPPKK